MFNLAASLGVFTINTCIEPQANIYYEISCYSLLLVILNNIFQIRFYRC